MIPPPYAQLRVTLPKFLIIAMREMVKEANAARDNDPRWSVSQLLESFLLQVITAQEMNAVAEKSPEFNREAEAWLRWLTDKSLAAKRRQQPLARKRIIRK